MPANPDLQQQAVTARRPSRARAVGARRPGRADVRARVAARRPRRRHRARRDPRPAGHGVRRARRAARRHRALHDDRLPRRVRAVRALARPGARPGLVDLPADPRVDHAALAGGDVGTAIALAGMLAVFVGLVEIALGLGKLGFVADLLSKEVQVGYMNGLGITIIVSQLPKLFGFSTDADGFVDEVAAFVSEPRPDRHDDARRRPRRCSPSLLVLPRITRRVPAILVAVVGRDGGLRGARPRRRGRRDRRRAAAGRADAHRSRGPTRATSLPLLLAAAGHRARLADRHDRHRDELRRAARRRGRARPGDGRAWARRTSPPGSSRGSPSRPAARAPPSPSSPAPRAR